MANESPQKSSTDSEKVYTNKVDKNYHQTVNCVLMLPTDYQEKQVNEAKQSGLKPCKRCTH
jgi:hypothetical protein